MGWWYVRRASGETAGPLNEAGVEAELDTGRLMPNGWVCPAGGREWLQVSAQRPFAAAVQRALVALGEAPTAFKEDHAKQAQLAALYEVSVEGRSPVADLPPSKRPTDPPPAARAASARPAPTLAMNEPVPPTQLERTAPMGPQPGPAQQAGAPQPHPTSPDGPVSVPVNPLTEPFGASGWAAVALNAFTAFVYLVDALVLVFSPAPWAALVAVVVAAGFGWATVQLMRRRAAGLRMARVGHGMLLALVSLSAVAHVAINRQFMFFMIIPLALLLLHVVSLTMLQVARALFWIRE